MVVQMRLNVRERAVEQGDFQYLHYVIFKQLVYKYSGTFGIIYFLIIVRKE